jgi:hypothetical protein
LYRILAVAAVLHAGVLLATCVYAIDRWDWPLRLWVGSTTVWFFWPIILSLHNGRSPRAAYASVAISAVLIVLPMHAYWNFAGRPVLLPEDGPTSLGPYDVGSYTIGYARGWIAAKQRAGTDPIVLEAYGLGRHTPAAPNFSDEVREQYRIEIEGIAGCLVNSYILGHAKGYNTASVSEIKRRYGSGVITAAEEEDAAREKRSTEMMESGRVDAAKHAREGRLLYHIYQPARADEEEYRQLLREHYQVELRRVAANPQELDGQRWPYVNGYNEAAGDEVKRRFGPNALQDLWLVEHRPVEQFRQALAAAKAGETKVER